VLSFYITLIIINFPITVPNNRISQKQFCDMSINRDLLTEAIADAKAVKETAIENAKLALEESFTPHLKSMLAAKLDEMDKEYEEDDVKAESENVDEVEVSEEVVNEKEEEKEVKEEKVDEIDLDEMLAELEANDTVEESKEEVSETEEVQESESDEISEADKDEDKKKMEESTEEVSEEDKVEEYGKKYEEDDVKTEAEEEEAEEESEEAGEESEEEEEIDLEDMSADDLKGFIEDVIKDMVESGELEGGDEMEAGDDLDMPMMEDETVEEVNEEDKDDKKKKVDESDEVVSEKKDDEDKKKMEEEMKKEDDDDKKKKMEESDSEEVSKALEEIEVLKTELNEVNLLNAKLLYTNKIFRDKNLTEDKKVKVLKAFDKASSVKEAKVIYETLNDGLINKSVDIKGIKGSASKATGTAPVAKKPIVESDAMVERFKKLAGII
jgi:hypothetical protein